MSYVALWQICLLQQTQRWLILLTLRNLQLRKVQRSINLSLNAVLKWSCNFSFTIAGDGIISQKKFHPLKTNAVNTNLTNQTIFQIVATIIVVNRFFSNLFKHRVTRAEPHSMWGLLYSQLTVWVAHCFFVKFWTRILLLGVHEPVFHEAGNIGRCTTHNFMLLVWNDSRFVSTEFSSYV